MIDPNAGTSEVAADAPLPLRNSEARFGKISTALHWAGALSVLAMLATAWWAWIAPDQASTVARLRLHGSIGIATYAIIAARIAWHFMERQPRKLGRSAALNATATIVHATLLGLIALQLLTGPLDVWSGGWGIEVFGLFEIPSPIGKQPWHDALGTLHRWTGYAITALVALHLAAVLKHTLVDGDDTLSRMLGFQPSSSGQESSGQ